MFDESFYEFKLQRLQRKRAATLKHFKRKWEQLLKDKGDRGARDEMRSREQFEVEEWDEDINQLTTQHLRNMALKLIVPLPPYDDGVSWFELKMFGYRLLTPHGVKTVRADIRAERKARWEFWQTRVTLALALIGSIFGILAYFKR